VAGGVARHGRSAPPVVPVLPNARAGTWTPPARSWRAAHGDVIILLRDGDQVPETCTWIKVGAPPPRTFPRFPLPCTVH